VLKGSLALGRKKAETFGDFGHQPMPHSVVVPSPNIKKWRILRGKKIAQRKLFKTACETKGTSLLINYRKVFCYIILLGWLHHGLGHILELFTMGLL